MHNRPPSHIMPPQHPTKNLLQAHKIQEIAPANLVLLPAEHHPPTIIQSQQPLRLNQSLFGCEVYLLYGDSIVAYADSIDESTIDTVQVE